jgi:hypothetical protein
MLMMLGTMSSIADEVRVIDGDTLVIGEQHYRLDGIGAPEARQDCNAVNGRQWRCGDKATRFHGSSDWREYAKIENVWDPERSLEFSRLPRLVFAWMADARSSPGDLCADEDGQDVQRNCYGD